LFFWDIWYTNLWLWTWWNPICVLSPSMAWHGHWRPLIQAMATSCTDISHIGGFLKWDKWGISIHLWWSMTTGWEHENMMRTGPMPISSVFFGDIH
jgi:hypothetical protein